MWILFKVCHKDKKRGTTRAEFPNDNTPAYVENDSFLTIESLLGARLLPNSGEDFSNNTIEINISTYALEKLNELKRKSPSAGIGVFVMNNPFAKIHFSELLEKPLLYWSGEDKAGAAIIVELINSYKAISET